MNRPEIGSLYKSPNGEVVEIAATWDGGVVFLGAEYTVTIEEFVAGYTHAD